MDLICSLYSWWEGFGAGTLPLSFNCGFIPTAACGSSTGVCSWGCPGGLGSSPVSARCGGGAAAYVAVALAAPAAQGSWPLGSRKHSALERCGNPLQHSCLENPLTEKPGRRTQSIGSQSWTQPKWSHMHRCKNFYFCSWKLYPKYWLLNKTICIVHGKIYVITGKNWIGR